VQQTSQEDATMVVVTTDYPHRVEEIVVSLREQDINTQRRKKEDKKTVVAIAFLIYLSQKSHEIFFVIVSSSLSM
jgi:hypothetical protein